MLSRRRLLAAGGVAAATLSAGYAVADSQTSVPPDPDGWPMARRDPGGTSYAPEASPPRDAVAVRWTHRIDGGSPIPYANPPVVADGRVYAVDRELLVLDAETGRTLARSDVEAQSAPAVAPARAYRSPTVALNRADGVAGLDPSGGVDVFGIGPGPERWTNSHRSRGVSMFTTRPVRAPPVADGGTVVASRSGRLIALDASTGEVRWRRTGDTPRPAVHDGTVYTGDDLRTLRGYDLQTGERRLDVTFEDRGIRSVTAGPDQLVVGARVGLLGLDHDGTVRWEYSAPDLGQGGGGIALADGVAYAGFDAPEGGRLVAVDVSDGTELWRSEVDTNITPRPPAPAVAAGVVYVSARFERLAAVDAADGHVRWTFEGESDEAGHWSPVAIDGETVYATRGSRIYALEEP